MIPVGFVLHSKLPAVCAFGHCSPLSVLCCHLQRYAVVESLRATAPLLMVRRLFVSVESPAGTYLNNSSLPCAAGTDSPAGTWSAECTGCTAGLNATVCTWHLCMLRRTLAVRAGSTITADPAFLRNYETHIQEAADRLRQRSLAAEFRLSLLSSAFGQL